MGKTPFEEAQDRVKALKQRPSNDELLQLYALYKQGTVGDVAGSRPGMFDMKERAKFDAWTKVRGVGKDEAQKRYVSFVDELAKKLG